MNYCTAALAALMLASVTQAGWAKDPPLLSLGMEHFRDTAAVTEDPANDSITISTERGYAEHWGPMRTVWHDEYLTGVIGQDGGKSFQVHVLITYSGAWRSYAGAHYQAAGGSQTVTPMLLEKETTNCAVGECMYTEHLAVPIDEALLRQVAASYEAGKPTLWTFDLVPKTGADYRGSLSNAEFAGLVARVDGYVRTPAVKADIPATPPRGLDFGISGTAVLPAADMPSRAGILVVGVTGGSVAQKAGIITGDIIYRIGARSVHSIPDLEAAVASAANSAAVIHLFRGTAETELEARF